jgi:two-component system sensor histidine kinase/response regulator
MCICVKGIITYQLPSRVNSLSLPLVQKSPVRSVEAVEKDNYDLVLMDVQMPEMDGLEATAAIRKREAGTDVHISIVALTAYAMKDDRDRCLAAGMDGYLTKPVRPQELDDLLQSYMARRMEATRTLATASVSSGDEKYPEQL